MEAWFIKLIIYVLRDNWDKKFPPQWYLFSGGKFLEVVYRTETDFNRASKDLWRCWEPEWSIWIGTETHIGVFIVSHQYFHKHLLLILFTEKIFYDLFSFFCFLNDWLIVKIDCIVFINIPTKTIIYSKIACFIGYWNNQEIISWIRMVESTEFSFSTS